MNRHVAALAALVVMVGTARADDPPCPRKSARRPPALGVYRTVADAKRQLALASHDEELFAKDPAFTVSSFRAGKSEGDRGVYLPNAVFVYGAGRARKLVVARALATNTTARPASPCMHVPDHRVTALRLVGPGNRVGHFRLLVDGARDRSSMPARTTGTCGDRVTYRIEDHFIDLERGRYLAIYDQVFEDTSDAALASLPGLAFEAFTIDGQLRISTGACRKNR